MISILDRHQGPRLHLPSRLNAAARVGNADAARSANALRLLASLPEPPDRNADHHDKSDRKRNGEIGNREDAVAAAMIRAEQARYVVRDTPGPAAADLARPARPDAWPAPNLRQRRTGLRRRRAVC